MSDLQRGDIVDGRYTVVSLLGRGGMAAVYLVHHRKLGSFHAVKVLEVDRPSMRTRLLKEGAVQSRLKHVNLVAVSDAIEVEGHAALVMEYIHGPNLAALIEQDRLELHQIDAIVAGLFDGLEMAHRQGIVHRDLKPHNVLLAVYEDSVVPKIADFGLVKVLDEEGVGGQTHTGTVFGTPEYMSPEQISDAKSVDARADLFSLGSMLFELVSGRRPFQGDNLLATLGRINVGERSTLRELVPDAPERMVVAVERALVVDRAQRVQTVSELRELWFSGAERTVARWNRARLLSLVAPLPVVSRDPATAPFGSTVVSAGGSGGRSPLEAPAPVALPTGFLEATPDGSMLRKATPVTLMSPRGGDVTLDSVSVELTPSEPLPPAEDDPDVGLPGGRTWLAAGAIASSVVVFAVIAVAGLWVVGSLADSRPAPSSPVEPVADAVTAPPEVPVVVASPEPAGAPRRPRPPVGSSAPSLPPVDVVPEPFIAPVAAALPPPVPAEPSRPAPSVPTSVIAPVAPPAQSVAVTPTGSGEPPRVRVVGGGDMTVMLRDASGVAHDVTEAKVGKYVVTAYLHDVKTEIGTVVLEPGSKWTIKCNYLAQKCAIVPG